MPCIAVKDIFAQGGLASHDQFDEWTQAWRVAAESGSQERILAFFSRERGLSEEVFLRQLAHAFGWPYVDLPKLAVSPEARQKISTKVAFQFFVLPIQFENGTLQIAVSNPLDTAMLNAVQFDAQCPIEIAVAPKDEIEKALKKYYGVGAETLDELAKDEPLELLVGEDKEITEGDQEASVIKFVNQIIWEAYKDRSTDIHFEPAEDELRIRYRIDGILHQTPMPPQLKRYQAALISRVKVMSGMNIAEKRLPQDGRINVRIKGEEIDIRVSTVPTVYGESVSLRLLTRGKIFLTLDKLGFAPADEAALRDLIVKPHGIMLVTGPTGAGKSTTLYACLSTINSVHKRIHKIEQKVERDYLIKIGFPEDEIATAKFWRGAGCDECRQLGYQGRLGIYELLLLNEAVRPLILHRAPASTIAQKAIEQGMRTLRHDGWNKVRAGLTTIEEVLRVTQTEEHMKGLVEV